MDVLLTQVLSLQKASWSDSVFWNNTGRMMINTWQTSEQEMWNTCLLEVPSNVSNQPTRFHLNLLWLLWNLQWNRKPSVALDQFVVAVITVSFPDSFHCLVKIIIAVTFLSHTFQGVEMSACLTDKYYIMLMLARMAEWVFAWNLTKDRVEMRCWKFYK